MKEKLLILTILVTMQVFSQNKEFTFSPAILAIKYVKFSEVSHWLFIIPILPVTISDYYVETRYNYDFENMTGLYFGKRI